MKPNNLSYKEIIQTEISICIPCFSFFFFPCATQIYIKLDSKFIFLSCMYQAALYSSIVRFLYTLLGHYLLTLYAIGDLGFFPPSSIYYYKQEYNRSNCNCLDAVMTMMIPWFTMNLNELPAA